MKSDLAMESSPKRRSAQTRWINEKRCRRIFFVADLGEKVFGSVMADYVGDDVNVNYSAELSSPKWVWYGRAIIPRAERELLFAGYPKLNLLVRSGNQDVLAFY